MCVSFTEGNLLALQRASRPDEPGPGRRIELLVADGDPDLRASIVAALEEDLGEISVLEAEDGTEAVQLALQRHPQIALLNVDMPRLGGIEAAATLREVRPGMQLALYADERHPHEERAHHFGLPLFGKRHLDDAIRWANAQTRQFAGTLTSRKPRSAGRVA